MRKQNPEALVHREGGMSFNGCPEYSVQTPEGRVFFYFDQEGPLALIKMRKDGYSWDEEGDPIKGFTRSTNLQSIETKVEETAIAFALSQAQSSRVTTEEDQGALQTTYPVRLIPPVPCATKGLPLIIRPVRPQPGEDLSGGDYDSGCGP